MSLHCEWRCDRCNHPGDINGDPYNPPLGWEKRRVISCVMVRTTGFSSGLPESGVKQSDICEGERKQFEFVLCTDCQKEHPPAVVRVASRESR